MDDGAGEEGRWWGEAGGCAEPAPYVVEFGGGVVGGGVSGEPVEVEGEPAGLVDTTTP